MPRSSSTSAPRIRVAAYRANGTPRSASKAWAAWTSAVRPAEVRSSRSTCAGTRADRLPDDVADERHVPPISASVARRDVVCRGSRERDLLDTGSKCEQLAVREKFRANGPWPHGPRSPMRGPSRDARSVREPSPRNSLRSSARRPMGAGRGRTTSTRSQGDGVEKLSPVLWRERELLETLQYRLEVEQLVMASGRTRWLAARGPRGRVDASSRSARPRCCAPSPPTRPPPPSAWPQPQPALRWSRPPTSRGARSSPTTARPSSRSPDEIARIAEANRDADHRRPARGARDAARTAATGTESYTADGAAVERRHPDRRRRQEPVAHGRSFSSLNTALSALRYHQVVMDVASTNIANVTTDGYVRRRVVGESVGARRQCPRCGRATTARRRCPGGRDRPDGRPAPRRPRPRRARQAVLPRPAGRRAGPGRDRAGRARRQRRRRRARRLPQALHDLVNAPGSDAARSQVLAAAETVADAVRIQARNLAGETADQQPGSPTRVAEVNTVAARAGRDQPQHRRGQPDRLRHGEPARRARPARDAAVRAHRRHGHRAARRHPGRHRSAASPWSAARRGRARWMLAPGGRPDRAFTVGAAGAGAGRARRRGRRDRRPARHQLPAYADGLDAVAKTFADQVNAQHHAGFDRDGSAGTALLHLRPRRRGAARSASPSPTRAGGGLRVATGGRPRRRQRRPAGRLHHRRRRLPAPGQRLRHDGRVGQAAGHQPAGPDHRRSTARASSSPASASTRRP